MTKWSRETTKIQKMFTILIYTEISQDKTG